MAKINSDKKGLAVMLKSMVRRSLHRRGLDLTKSPTVMTYLEVHQVDLVLDVGANLGQYGSGLRQRGYKGRIWSFEPIREVFDELEARVRTDEDWKVTRVAVGAVPGEALINVSESTVFSSLKTAKENPPAFDKGLAVVKRERVRVEKLDNLMIGETAKRIFLKIDTQGFEKEVLEGAGELRKGLVGIQLEIPVENLYSDVWSFTTCVEFMADHGYLPAQFKMVNSLSGDPSSALEFDCIFRPR